MLPLHYVPCVEEAEVVNGMRSRATRPQYGVNFTTAGPKNYGYRTQKGKVECKVRGVFPSWSTGPWRGLWKGRNMVGGRRLFTNEDLCAWVYGRSRTKTPKGRMFKKV